MTKPVENRYFEFAKSELCELIKKKKMLQESFSFEQADELKENYEKLVNKAIECIKLGLSFEEKDSEIVVEADDETVTITKKDLVEVMGEKQFLIFFKPEPVEEETFESVEAVVDNPLFAGLNKFKEMDGKDNMFSYMVYGFMKSFEMYQENHSPKKEENTAQSVADKELEEKYARLVKENGTLLTSKQWLEAENARIMDENAQLLNICKELSIKNFAAYEEINASYTAVREAEEKIEALTKELQGVRNTAKDDKKAKNQIVALEEELKAAKREIKRLNRNQKDTLDKLREAEERATLVNEELTATDVNSDLYKLAYTDTLTGVMNANAFNRDAMTLDITKVVIGMIGIRGLKAINDAYGRRDGDGVIEYVGECLASTFGSNNVYRIMGDQFIIVGEIPSSEMKKQLTKLKKALREDNNINIVFYAASNKDVVNESGKKRCSTVDMIDYVESKITEQKKELFVMDNFFLDSLKEDETIEEEFEEVEVVEEIENDSDESDGISEVIIDEEDETVSEDDVLAGFLNDMVKAG